VFTPKSHLRRATSRGSRQWSGHEFDNFSFIIYELFLTSVACALKHENFAFAGALINQDYYAPAVTRRSDKSVVRFTMLQTLEIPTIDEISRRTNQQRASNRAHLISQRITGTDLTMADIGQADLVLALKARASDDHWTPDTLLYADRYRALPIFARSRSKRYFAKVAEALTLDLDQIREVVTEVDGRGGLFRQHTFGLRLAVLTGLDELCSTA